MSVAAASIELTSIYDAWFAHVYRWVRAHGCAEADVEDVTQEVFLIVQRKLGAFDGRNLAGWLYRITARTVRDHRRHSWFKHIFSRPRDIELGGLRSEEKDPLQILEQQRERTRVHDAVAKMNPKWRTTFVLFEIEGFSGEEIASFQNVPVATIWTHLHRGRKEFVSFIGEGPC